MTGLAEIRRTIEHYLRYPSDWRIESAAGMNATEGLGVGVERLQLRHPAQSCRVDVTTLQGGITTSPISLDGSSQAFPSGLLNRVYRGPMYRDVPIRPVDFEGGVRTAALTWNWFVGGSVTLYVFGSVAFATATAATGFPPASLALMFGTARAIALYASSNTGTPDMGIVFGAGYARVSQAQTPG